MPDSRLLVRSDLPSYIIVLPAEISAAAVLISYWTPAGQVDATCTTGICNNALWVALMLIVVVSPLVH